MRRHEAGAAIRLSTSGITRPGNSDDDNDEAIVLQDFDSLEASSASSTSVDLDSVDMPLKKQSEFAEAEITPLLTEHRSSGDGDGERHLDGHGYGDEDGIARLTAWQLGGLYVSHSLSMWNSRSYEFAAVLFTAAAYPGTLTAASIRGLSANLAALLLSSAVGRWCNRHPSRLKTLQVSILLQRVCIAIACIGWAVIIQADDVDRRKPRHDDQDDRFAGREWIKTCIFAALIAAGMLEKVSSVGNLLVMERDWVPLLASPDSKPPLHVLNATMKRIDLISKLLAPLFVSVAAIWVGSLRMTTLVIAGMQILSVVPELALAHRVWRACPSLQEARDCSDVIRVVESEDLLMPEVDFQRDEVKPTTRLPSFKERIHGWSHGLRLYFSSPVCAPSMALALQPFSVLTMSASMTTYLLSAHFPLSIITTARTFSTAVELSSTVLTPMLISWLSVRSVRKHGSQHESLRPLTRVGLWGLWWQLVTLVPVTAALLLLPTTSNDPAAAFPRLTGIIFVFIALSRLGPFGYGLVEQTLVQMAVPASERVEFSGVEMAFVSGAELLRWAMTGVWGKPEQFKGVAVGALATIALTTLTFWMWSWRWWARFGELHCQR